MAEREQSAEKGVPVFYYRGEVDNRPIGRGIVIKEGVYAERGLDLEDALKVGGLSIEIFAWEPGSAVSIFELISDLTDDTKCSYDREGYCQTHDVGSRPCAHERAQRLLAAIKKIPGGTEG